MFVVSLITEAGTDRAGGGDQRVIDRDGARSARRDFKWNRRDAAVLNRDHPADLAADD